MLQDGFAKADQMIELKVEVFYGRAYLATSSPDTGPWLEKHYPECKVIALRDGTIETYCNKDERGMKYHSVTKGLDWIRTEGHLERLWKLAEDAAKIMSIDYIRMDIFVRKGDPDGLVINEDSLSSGIG